MFGPAFVAAVAYVDPGNVATNVAAGSAHGYLLLWVVGAANAAAMLVQYLAAKVGMATGRSLPAVARAEWSTPVVMLLWVQAEVVAAATDLAEVVGGALALWLLAGVPLAVGALLIGGCSVALLFLRDLGLRRFEVAVGALLVVVLLAFVVLGCGRTRTPQPSPGA